MGQSSNDTFPTRMHWPSHAGPRRAAAQPAKAPYALAAKSKSSRNITRSPTHTPGCEPPLTLGQNSRYTHQGEKRHRTGKRLSPDIYETAKAGPPSAPPEPPRKAGPRPWCHIMVTSTPAFFGPPLFWGFPQPPPTPRGPRNKFESLAAHDAIVMSRCVKNVGRIAVQDRQ